MLTDVVSTVRMMVEICLFSLIGQGVLSVLPEEIADGIERLQAELKDAGRAAKRTQEELAGFRAAGLRASAATIGPWRGVLTAQPGWDAGALKSLASAIVSEPG